VGATPQPRHRASRTTIRSARRTAAQIVADSRSSFAPCIRTFASGSKATRSGRGPIEAGSSVRPGPGTGVFAQQGAGPMATPAAACPAGQLPPPRCPHPRLQAHRRRGGQERFQIGRFDRGVKTARRSAVGAPSGLFVGPIVASKTIVSWRDDRDVGCAARADPGLVQRMGPSSRTEAVCGVVKENGSNNFATVDLPDPLGSDEGRANSPGLRRTDPPRRRVSTASIGRD